MSPVVPPFNNHLPVRIVFGDGVAGHLGATVKALDAKRALVIVDAELEQQICAVAGSIQTLGDAGIDPIRFEKEVGEPTAAVVDAVTAAITGSQVDAIVAIGGGSVIDAAKAGRLCAQHGCSFAELPDTATRYTETAIPLIAVPTTSGTGSEVSGGAVVTDETAGTKTGLAHPTMRPQYALVDPLLTRSLPPHITAYTGIDALAQAIAGMIARSHTPIGDAIALGAIRYAGRSLVAAFRDGNDAEARSEMACASLMAGLTMNISDCAAEHSLAQAIGGMFGAPHGMTVGLVLAETLDRERAYVPETLERVADALGVPDDGSGDGSRAVRGIQDLLAALEFPLLRAIGASQSDVETLADMALGDFFITQSPEPWTAEEVRTVFETALQITDRSAAPTLAP